MGKMKIEIVFYFSLFWNRELSCDCCQLLLYFPVDGQEMEQVSRERRSSKIDGME